MTSLLVAAIYLSFIYDFVLAPIPSEASTHNLVSKPERLKPWQRTILTVTHAGLLALWIFPLVVALTTMASGNQQGSGVLPWVAWQWVALPWVALPWVGILIAVAGRCTTISASIELRRRGTAAVVDSGVFSFSRHPIVVGLHLTLFGLLLSSGYLICLLLFPLTLLYFDQKVRIEEVALLQRFGESYREYARVTPRYLLKVGKCLANHVGN